MLIEFISSRDEEFVAKSPYLEVDEVQYILNEFGQSFAVKTIEDNLLFNRFIERGLDFLFNVSSERIDSVIYKIFNLGDTLYVDVLLFYVGKYKYYKALSLLEYTALYSGDINIKCSAIDAIMKMCKRTSLNILGEIKDFEHYNSRGNTPGELAEFAILQIEAIGT